MAQVPNFNEFMAARGMPKWVVARKTERILANYPDSNILSQSAYLALCGEHAEEVERITVDIVAEAGLPLREALQMAYRLGRVA